MVLYRSVCCLCGMTGAFAEPVGSHRLEACAADCLVHLVHLLSPLEDM